MVLGLVLFSLLTFWFNFWLVKSNLLKFFRADVSIVVEKLKEPGWKFFFFETGPLVSTVQLTMFFFKLNFKTGFKTFKTVVMKYFSFCFLLLKLACVIIWTIYCNWFHFMIVITVLFISVTWDEPFWAVFAAYTWKQKSFLSLFQWLKISKLK